MPQNTTPVSSAGITVNAATGERYIPSSIRADGSKRREIRIRPGYKPPEDIELYKNRAAEAWKNRGKAGVPGAEGLSNEDSTSSSSNNNKNAKRREARKKAKAAAGQEDSSSNDGPKGEKDIAALDNWRSFAATSGGEGKKKPEEQQQQEAPVDPEAEKEKKARNLKKKLRQARELSDKKDKGESLLPEQLEKVIKIQELIRQLDSLGFDSNGEKKASSEEKAKEKEKV